MDFKNFVFDFLASFFIVLKRFFQLIFFPYKAIRKISKEKDAYQIIIIFSLVFIYFLISSNIRDSSFSFLFPFLIFVINLLVSVLFFYFFSSIFSKKMSIRPYLFSFTYSLFPTLIWFIINSFLYVILPPPRTESFLGISFSILFVAFSLSLFIWRLILLYLSVRFSSRLDFNKILYMIFIYFCLFIPYSFFLYYFKIFRIPFI